MTVFAIALGSAVIGAVVLLLVWAAVQTQRLEASRPRREVLLADSSRPRPDWGLVFLGVAVVVFPPLGLLASALLLGRGAWGRAVAVLLLSGLGLLLYLSYLAYAMMKAYEAGWNGVY